MPTIQILDKHVAELIAAGEVVERPASVAKELLENAIDAGATQVTLSIVKGGIEQLQIVDNGCGIDMEDMQKAFIRHATSKISTEADLEEIHTLGFRGEALASVASVAKVEVLSRPENQEFACRYRIEGGVEVSQEVDARPVGTTITVNQLFFNTPARMKFLKKDASEGTFVADVIQHVALSYPEVAFRFVREGKQQFATPGDGKMISAAYAVLGREFSKDLLEVHSRQGLYQVTGLITPPRACRASRSAQYFYINGRYVKNRTMMAALEGAFKGTLMQGKFPGGILMLTMPAKLVDVNVHPAKTEVRFARDGEVFDAVYYAVKEALAAPGSGDRTFTFDGKNTSKEEPVEKEVPAVPRCAPAPQPAYTAAPQPQRHFATVTAQEYRAMQQLTEPVPAKPLPKIQPVQSFAEPVVLRSERANRPAASAYRTTADEHILDILPEETEQDMIPAPAVAALSENHKKEMTAPAAEAESNQTKESITPEQPAQREEIPAAAQQLSMEPEDAELPLKYVGEVFKTYIITQRGDEMCLLDKHAAHERILYEQLMADYGKVAGQTLLEPVQVNLSAEEKQAVLDNLEMLSDTGLDIADFGGSTVLVREVPADVRTDDIEGLVVEVAARLAEGSKTALSERTEWVMHSMACRAAIKGGDSDSPEGLLKLAQDILSGRVPPFCPHGRPVVLRITRRELEKQFGRIV